MDSAKIMLSPQESELVLRADWILTKNAVLEKVKQLLGRVQRLQIPSIAALPREVVATGAKISKGENYRGLPYLVLDHPRYFDREDILAIRTMFWWGHFFSCTLHLSGRYQAHYAGKIIAAFPLLQQAGFYVCIHPDPWEHHFETGNYAPLAAMTATGFGSIIRNHPFIKLAKKTGLEQWENAEQELPAISAQLVSVLL